MKTTLSILFALVLSNMLPISAFKNSLNACAGNAKTAAKSRMRFSPGSVHGANEQNLFIREFCRYMLFSIRHFAMHGQFSGFAHAGAPLGEHVGYIVGMGSEKEMVGVNAGRIIAFMENMERKFRGSISHCPGYTGRQKNGTSNSELPISIRRPISLPFPTIIRAQDFNFRPEPNKICAIPFGDFTVTHG